MIAMISIELCKQNTKGVILKIFTKERYFNINVYCIDDNSLVGLKFGELAKQSAWWKKIWKINFTRL